MTKGWQERKNNEFLAWQQTTESPFTSLVVYVILVCGQIPFANNTNTQNKSGDKNAAKSSPKNSEAPS